MSYRNDHDAAIARVDDLSQQLGRADAERARLHAALERMQRRERHDDDGRQRLAALEVERAAAIAERAAAIAERDRLRAQLERRSDSDRRPSRHRGQMVFGAMVLIGGLLGMAIERPRHASRAPVAPAADRAPDRSGALRAPAPVLRAPAPVLRVPANPSVRDKVIACAARLQHESDLLASQTDLRQLRASCRAEIHELLDRGHVSAEGAEWLARWIVLEDQLSPPLAAFNAYVLRDPAGAFDAAPSSVWREFHDALRARDAILPEVFIALQR